MPNIISCPECGAQVIACDNLVYLNHPAEMWDGLHVGWTIMQLGGQNIASNGDPSPHGTAHRLHEHQPEESVFA